MSGKQGPWDEATELRAIRLATAQRAAIRPMGRVRFKVASSDGTTAYQVAADQDGWSCACTAWADRQQPCKHIVAVVRWLDPNPPPILAEEVFPQRPTYTQASWPHYDQAQQLEHQLFDRYLWDLLGGVSERVCETGRRGRPTVPLRTQVLMAVRKVHLGQSTRRARGLLIALNQDGKGILPRIPNYSVPSRLFNRPQALPLLTGLVERSGLVLKDIEDRGTVAVDSSGFCTSCMGAYCTEMHDPDRRHLWVKLHIAVGVKTHVALSVKITDEHGADSPQFVPLLSRLTEIGHTPSRVVADKAYLSRGNLDLAGELGIDPYVPFKVNSRGLSKGSPMWTRKYHEFMSRRDEFDEAYHQRSNVEATFSAIKRKLGEPLLSHTPSARIAELTAKVLAYNIGIVIQQSHLHGFDPGAVATTQNGPDSGTVAIAEVS